ncbi:MAG: carbohydrate kinase family protein, partial [Spirochaetota bacterium]
VEDTTGFTIAPGGAPANVAAAVAGLGGSSGFIGKVGDDSFGKRITKTLAEAGVDTRLLIMDRTVNTTLAFISVGENNEPDFTFYRSHCGADLALRSDELDEGYIYDSKILHFGSLSFTGEPLRATTRKAIQIARSAGKIVSFDPNLRPSLWENLRHAREEMENGLEYADVVKLTEEETEFITGTSKLSRGTDMLLKFGPRMIVVTRGSRSCYFNNGMEAFEVPAYSVTPEDTTGAGDAFVGGMLLKITQRIKTDRSVFTMDKQEAEGIVRFAHACGAIIVTRKGVIPALPTIQEVQKFMSEHQ